MSYSFYIWTPNLIIVPTTMPENPKIASIGYNAVVLTWTPYKNVTGYKVRKNI